MPARRNSNGPPEWRDDRYLDADDGNVHRCRYCGRLDADCTIETCTHDRHGVIRDCLWVLDENDYWRGECGATYFNEDDPATIHTGFNYCHRCGKKIAVDKKGIAKLMNSRITYTRIEKSDSIRVLLDGKVTGTIRPQYPGYAYVPRGNGGQGETFPTLEECKRSLEED